VVVDEEVNHILTEMRLNAGHSQRSLAREIGISVEVIKYAESGRGRPRPQNMKLIADWFGVPVTTIWPPKR
jgi:transcriptional regulator with XRE-family HTH domain